MLIYLLDFFKYSRNFEALELIDQMSKSVDNA